MVARFGFTLVEIIVVMGIMTFMMLLLFANYPQFAKRINIDREASKLALALRKSQSYALEVREFNSSYADDPFCTAPPVRFPPYGVSLSTLGGVGDPRNNITYVIFGDSDCSGSYTYPVISPIGLEESIEVVKIESSRAPAVIESMAGYSAVCPQPTGCALTSVDAVYQRPSPTINILGDDGAYPSLEYVEIILSISGENTKRKVIIRNTGDVAIQ